MIYFNYFIIGETNWTVSHRFGLMCPLSVAKNRRIKMTTKKFTDFSFSLSLSYIVHAMCLYRRRLSVKWQRAEMVSNDIWLLNCLIGILITWFYTKFICFYWLYWLKSLQHWMVFFWLLLTILLFKRHHFEPLTKNYRWLFVEFTN